MSVSQGKEPGSAAQGASRPGAGERASQGSGAADGLKAILNVSRALAGKLELEHILGVAVGVMGEVVGAEGASILLIDPETGGMSFHVAEGPGAEVAKTIPLPPGEGICGHVARTGEPIIVNDAQNDPRLYRPVDQATQLTTRSLLAVPIRSNERLWGVLEVINKKAGRPFTQEDLRLAEVVGTQTALAFENAHLHRQIVQKERMAAIGQTVSGLAHCIKNILNGIRSGSAVIDRSMANGDQQEVSKGWNIVRRNNEMLGNLVLDMLSLARDSKPHAFPTDVNDLAEQVCGLMSDRAAERKILLRFVPAPGLPDVPLDPTHFYRSLLNLVSNAVDACGDGGRIMVRVCRAVGSDRFTVSVTDDGAGIGKADSKRLFAEFFSTKGGRGTGLGLPVTKKLVGEMGGTVKFHSVLGRGTRFVMALPVGAA